MSKLYGELLGMFKQVGGPLARNIALDRISDIMKELRIGTSVERLDQIDDVLLALDESGHWPPSSEGHAPKAETTPHVVALGCGFGTEGFVLVGPFDNFEMAQAYHDGCNDEPVIVPLSKPDPDTPAHKDRQKIAKIVRETHPPLEGMEARRYELEIRRQIEKIMTACTKGGLLLSKVQVKHCNVGKGPYRVLAELLLPIIEVPPDPTFEQRYREAMSNPDAIHPIQPLIIDEQGIRRFKRNLVVNRLYEWAAGKGMGMNEMAKWQDIPKEEFQQFAQLIGYSLGGYGELSYVTDEAYEAALKNAKDKP